MPVERPVTEAELVEVVKAAAAARLSVRMGRPSHARLVKSNQILLDLADYRRFLRVDREAGEATVEAGITVRRLGEVLGSWGLSLENGGRDPAQTLGAALSVGAHGSGARFGILATQVTGMRLITPDGAVVSCSATEEPEIFDAARVGLGALGVISTVTLRCQSGFNVAANTASMDLSQALERFEVDVDGNDYYELSWLPGRNRARVVTANRTIQPADGAAVDRSYRWWNRRRVWPPRIAYSVPRQDAAPALQRAMKLSAGSRAGSQRAVGSDGHGEAGSVLVMRRVRELSAGYRPALPFPIEVSVTAGDDIALSPAYGQASVHIAGLVGLDGRPQWGSAHGLSVHALRAMYPQWDAWQAVRDRLDPDRRFSHTRGQG